MTNSSWNEYKKSITVLTKDQIEVMEDEAKKIADALSKKEVEEADK